MRILLLANSWVGLKTCEYLKERKEDIVGLAIHEPEKQKLTQKIIRAAGVSKQHVYLAHELREKKTLTKIKKLKPDIVIASFWAYILKPEFIEIPPRGCINFHPAYLPFNRGMNPNVWPFIEGTQAGVTIHYIDPGIDTGDIIARKKVPIDSIDTAETLYNKTLIAIVDLFQDVWPGIKAGGNPRIPQNSLKEGQTFHKAKDVNQLDYIDLKKRYVARQLINILRARSYNDKYYTYFEDGGKRVYIRVQLAYDNNIKK